MKKIFLAMLSWPCISSAQLTEQDFSSSSVVADYVSATPTAGQFNSIGTSGPGVAVSISSGQLRFVRAGANTGSFTRNTDLAGLPSTLIFQMDLTFSGTTTAATSVCVFYAGSNFSTTNTTEANADVYARFSVNTTTTEGNFVLRDITNGTNSTTLSGTTRITWVMNNSGTPMTYKGPGGSISSIANDKADIWGGNTLLFDEVSVQTPAQTITDLKFIMNQGSQILDIDNILADPIPPPTISNTPSEVGSTSFTAHWNTQPGVNGYRLDVSASSDFSNFVTGYEGLLLSGTSTNSQAVSGLQWGFVYYYRVRTSSKYSGGEFESDHSNVTSVVTGILPVHFTSIQARWQQDGVQISFTNATESSLKEYLVQRSYDGRKFHLIQTIQPVKNNESGVSYSVRDHPPGKSTHFYRIAAIGADGSITLSPIVFISPKENGRPGLQFPGQVYNRRFNINMGQLLPGNYTLSVFNSHGLRVSRSGFATDGSKKIIPVDLGNSVAGIYLWSLHGPVDLSGKFVLLE